MNATESLKLAANEDFITCYGEGVQCVDVPVFEIYVMLGPASGLRYCGKIRTFI
jgi:hypothetical protein